MIKLQVWERQRWAERDVTVDDLARLIHEDAAVAWDRDVATASGIPWDSEPRLYAMGDSGYVRPCVVFGAPMGYWTVVAVWLESDVRWDVRRRRKEDSPPIADPFRRYALQDYLNDDTWIRIATGR